MFTEDYVARLESVARAHRIELPPRGESTTRYVEEIRGRLNARLLLSPTTQPWMKPRWATRIRPDDGIECLVNGTEADWVPIGGAGGRGVGHSDSAGLTTGLEGCGGLDFWLLGEDGEVLFPALCEEAVLECPSIEDQVFVWSKQVGPVEFIRHIYYGEDDGRPALYNEVHVSNKSLDNVGFTFFAALRPLSIHGIEPLVEIEYDALLRRLVANGAVAVESDASPDTVFLAWADSSSLIDEITAQTEREDNEIRTPRGLATAVLRYDLDLRPAGEMIIFFVQPLSLIARDAPEYAKTPEMRHATVERWFDLMDNTVGVILPNSGVQDAITQAKAVIMSHALPASESSLCDLSETELAGLILALARTGASTVLADVTRRVLAEVARCKSEGLVNRMPVIWAILQTHMYLPDLRVFDSAGIPLESLSERLVGELRRIARPPAGNDERTGTETQLSTQRGEETTTPTVYGSGETVESYDEETVGSPPRTTSGEEPTIRKLIDTVWTVITARRLAALLRRVGSHGAAERLDGTSEWVDRIFQDAIERIGIRLRAVSLNPYIVSDLMRVTDSVILLGRGALTRHLIDDVTKSTERLLQAAREDRLQAVRHLIPGLRFRLFHLNVLRSDRDRVEALAEDIFEGISRYHTLSDESAQNNTTPITVGCVLRSAIGLVLAASEMLVCEQNGVLVLLRAIPEEWFTTKREVRIWNVPTTYGRVEVSVGSSMNQFQIEVNSESLPEEILVYVPYSRQLNTFKAYGGSIVDRMESPVAPCLRIVPLSTNVVVTYHR